MGIAGAAGFRWSYPCHANAQAVQLLGRCKFALRRDELCAGGKVRYAEVHLLGPLVGNGEVGQYQVHLVGLQQRHTVGRIGGHQLQFHAQTVCNFLSVIHVQTHDLAGLGIGKAKRRVGIKDGDAYHAGVLMSCRRSAHAEVPVSKAAPVAIAVIHGFSGMFSVLRNQQYMFPVQTGRMPVLQVLHAL